VLPLKRDINSFGRCPAILMTQPARRDCNLPAPLALSSRIVTTSCVPQRLGPSGQPGLHVTLYNAHSSPSDESLLIRHRVETRTPLPRLQTDRRPRPI
jgi:hypothetical protein